MKLKSILKKGLFVIALLLTLGFLAWHFENFRGRHAWRKYKAQAQARGEVMDPKKVIPPTIPDSSNFAAIPFFSKLFVIEEGTTGTNNGQADYFDGVPSARGEGKTNTLSHTWVTSLADLPALAMEVRKKQTGDDSTSPMAEPGVATPAAASNAGVDAPNATEAAIEILEFLKQYEPALNEMAAAAPRPQSRYPIRYEQVPAFNILLPHLRVLRGAGNALRVRSAAMLQVGKSDEAAADILLIWRLADSIKDEPILISHLVRVALLHIAYQPLADGMARNAWTDSQLEQFQRALLATDLRQELAKTLEGETLLFGINSLEQAREGLITESGADSWPGVGRWMPDGWLCLEIINYHKTMSAFSEAVLAEQGRITPGNLRTSQANALLQTLEAPGINAIFSHRIFSRVLIPAVVRIAERTARAQMGTRLAGLACALERYRLAKNTYPASLAELEPLIGGGIPRDIVTGGPLQYRLTGPDGYVLYSPGSDGQDDGGNRFLERMKPEKQEGTDWVWTPFPPPSGVGK